MANFYGTARSNYVAVKDATAFKAWVDSIPDLRLLTQVDDTDPDKIVVRYGIASECPDSGCFPSSLPDLYEGDDGYVEGGDSNEYRELDLPHEIAKHLVDGEVCILMEAGAEKLRYISGWAEAFDSSGVVVRLHLNDIYRMAKAKFGEDANITDASY